MISSAVSTGFRRTVLFWSDLNRQALSESKVRELAIMNLTSPADLFESPASIYRAEDLRYFLIAGDTPWLESLRIMDSRQRTWADREVTFYALGASHALSIRHGDLLITELLSCREGFRRNQCLAEMKAAEPPVS